MEVQAGGHREDADGAGLDPAAGGIDGRGGGGGVLPAQGVEGGVQAGLVSSTGTRKCACLASRRKRALSRVVCMAVTRTPSRGSGSSSGWKWLTSLALPALANLSWLITSPVTWVMAPSRCTFFFRAALASLRSLPSTATAGRAGMWPRSPVTAGPSHGWPGAARTQPAPRTSRSALAARGLRRRLLCCLLSFLLARRAGTRVAGRGSSAAAAAHPDSPACSSSASSSRGSRPSVDALSGSCRPVTGLRRVPCAASSR